VTHRVVTPIEVDESRLHAYCHLRDDERSFWLSSILAAGAAPD
jgi:predicted DNA-binding transcriptional regulator YafY